MRRVVVFTYYNTIMSKEKVTLTLDTEQQLRRPLRVGALKFVGRCLEARPAR